MLDTIKNIIICFLFSYISIDILSLFFLSKNNPHYIKIFIGNFKEPKHLSILFISLLLAFIVFKLLEKNDENSI